MIFLVPKRLLGQNFGFWGQTFWPNCPQCSPPKIVKILTMLVERVNIQLRKKLWESDTVNSYSTSKYETFYSFFTNSQGYFCKIESGRIFRRPLFHFQRLGCERQQVGTKPSINSCRIDLRCFILKQAKYHGSKNLINFCHLDWEFSGGYQKVCVYNFLFVYDFVSLQGL